MNKLISLTEKLPVISRNFQPKNNEDELSLENYLKIEFIFREIKNLQFIIIYTTE